MNTKGLLIASAAGALSPLGSVLFIAALGIGGLFFAIAFVKEFGSAAHSTDPSRCPACHRDDLLRIEASAYRSPIPLLHCRSCGEAFHLYGNSLIRDTGRLVF